MTIHRMAFLRMAINRKKVSTPPLRPIPAIGATIGPPTSLVFHQNLESFADRVGLIVALQSNGKLSQEQAYDQIRKIWKKLRESKKDLLA